MSESMSAGITQSNDGIFLGGPCFQYYFGNVRQEEDGCMIWAYHF